MPNLRKYNRRWVTDHAEYVSLDATSLNVLIDKLKEVRGHFVLGSPVSVRVHTFSGALTLAGIRFATPEEVKGHDEQERSRKAKEETARKLRVQAALDVLNQEAPHILNRTNVSAEEILEENAI